MALSKAFAAIVIAIFLLAMFSAGYYALSQPRQHRAPPAVTSTRARVTTTTSPQNLTTTTSTTSAVTYTPSFLVFVTAVPVNADGKLNVSAIVFYDGTPNVTLTYAALRWPNGTVACQRELNITMKYYSDARVWVSCDSVPFRPGEQVYMIVMDSANETASYEVTVP
ncbi:hypothetical protein [Acidilobus sp.]|uniref:hypothetical protein n=1 Tax=Acidilobus sp. TaxID=1872109 RepID=UPI003CFFBCA3